MAEMKIFEKTPVQVGKGIINLNESTLAGKLGLPEDMATTTQRRLLEIEKKPSYIKDANSKVKRIFREFVNFEEKPNETEDKKLQTELKGNRAYAISLMIDNPTNCNEPFQKVLVDAEFTRSLLELALDSDMRATTDHQLRNDPAQKAKFDKYINFIDDLHTTATIPPNPLP